MRLVCSTNYCARSSRALIYKYFCIILGIVTFVVTVTTLLSALRYRCFHPRLMKGVYPNPTPHGGTDPFGTFATYTGTSPGHEEKQAPKARQRIGPLIQIQTSAQYHALRQATDSGNTNKDLKGSFLLYASPSATLRMTRKDMPSECHGERSRTMTSVTRRPGCGIF